MIHSFQMLGVIRKITIAGGNNRNTEARTGDDAGAPAEGGQDRTKGPSALLFIQYGPRREPTLRAVEFINAVNVRVPNYKYPMLQDKLKVGQLVEIHGRIQGVYKPGNEEGHMSNELVVERVVPQDRTQAPFAPESE